MNLENLQKNLSLVKNTKKRIEWIDVAKGITIITVIFGHGEISGPLRAMIFSFHMPLFFILSIVTYNLSKNNDIFVKKIEKSFKHLILPAFFIYTINYLLSNGIFYGNNFDTIDIRMGINGFVYASGVPVQVSNSSISAMGIPWFLFVLFFARSLFDYLYMKLSKPFFIFSTFVCSICGLIFSYLQWLPFSFDIVLVIQPLFIVGLILKKYWNKIRPTILLISSSCILWITLVVSIKFFSDTYLEIAQRRYPLYPLCFVAAIFGTFFVCLISMYIQKIQYINKVKNLLQYIGMNSMVLIWVHCFDPYFSNIYNITSIGNINAVIRVVVDLIIFYIFELSFTFVKKYIYMNKFRNNLE